MADPADPAADRPVVLVGLMGAGKTSVATRLARALGRPVRDNDEDLQRRYGGSAAEQYEQHGAGVLHAREAAALLDALAQLPPPVIAAAASVVEDPTCQQALTGAFVVWLDAPPEVLAGRLAGDPAPDVADGAEGDHRPQYHPDPYTVLAAQHRRRAEQFREVADLVVDVSDTTPDQAAETVLAALSGRPGPTDPAGLRPIDRSGPPP